MKISIKREQSQTGLSFAEREKFRPQAKRLFLLIISALLMTAQRAWADYVTDIVVIGHDSGKQIGYLYDNYKGAGWIGIDRDLNDGAGGHYVHLVYKTNTSPNNSGTPITDLYLWSAPYAGPASLVHNGRTYYRVGADGDSDFTSRGGDLNCEAGGNWIHLYYTKDQFKPQRRLTGISVDENASGCLGENGGSTPGDLNRGAGGDDIFLHFKTEYVSWDEHRAGSFSHEDGNTIYIESEAELAKLAHDVNNYNNYRGKTIVLNRDLDLSEYAWEPIGDRYWFDDHLGYLDNSRWIVKPFKGNFDGRGHTIRGLFVDRNDDCVGLFGCIAGWGSIKGDSYVTGCEWIKNLNIIGAYVHGNKHVAALAGYSFGGRFYIENVMVQGRISGSNYVGGIVGYGDNEVWLSGSYIVSIRNCANLGSYVSGGAIYGYLEDKGPTVNQANYYANFISPGNSNVYRLSAVRHNTLPEGIKLNVSSDACYWLDDVPYCKNGATVSYEASNSSFYYDLTGTSMDGEQKGLKHSFTTAEDTDYTIDVAYDATGITGSGTEADPYLLTADKQWTQLLHMYSQGRRFNGTGFKLGADISVSAVMPEFGGTFDGDGHTMNVSLTATNTYCAPFRSASNATFKNLHTAGTIATDKTGSAGLVGRAYGTTSIANCRSSVSILSSKPGHGGHGGLVGTVSGEEVNVNIDGCLFDGKMLTVGDEATTGCGGIVGEKSNRPTFAITNSLYAPAPLADGEHEAAAFSHTLAHYTDGIAPSITNVGYTRPLGTAQGARGTDTQPAGIGNVVTTYSVSGITSYDAGIEHDGWWYMNSNKVELADNAPNSSLISETADANGDQPVDVTLQGRTFYGDGNWNTLCLPFDVTLADSPLAGAEARTLSEATLSGGTLTLNFSEPVATLTAGTPYILRWAPEAVHDDYIIRTAQDWNDFADAVNSGWDYSQRTVHLMADITVSTSAGTQAHPFRGVFDGDGHTLTFNATASGYYFAPFGITKDATIQNLHTAGTITTGKDYCSGLVGASTESLSVINCRVSVDIVDTGGGYQGGFLGLLASKKTTFTNCLFDGSFTNKSGSKLKCAGFVMNLLADLSQYNNCLSKPKSITGNSAFCAFGYYLMQGPTVTNSYYYEDFPSTKADGTPVGSMTNEELAAVLGDGWQLTDGELLPIMQVNNPGGSILNPIFYGAAITATQPLGITPGLAPGTNGDGSVTFVGTYDPVTIGPEGDNTKLYFSTGNTLYWPNGAMTINPFRAYLQLNGATAQTRAYVINFGNDNVETGIIEAEANSSLFTLHSSLKEGWYTLDGLKLQGKPTAKGIYIHNGRKYIIK